jgi:hypothetical protein
MQIEKQADYKKNEIDNSGTATILVDGVPHVVVDYYDPNAAINYKVLKDGKEVETALAYDIYKAYNEELESFIDDILDSPPLEVVDDG